MDKEAKAREIKALLMGDAAALEKAIESLGDSDPVTQEWATVALRKWKGDPERARKALLDFFEEHDREALRCYALDALGRLGTHIPIDRLPDLIGQYPDTPKPMVLGKALHWIAKV